jgi:hypothetical protein
MPIDIEPCLLHMCDLRRVFIGVEITTNERRPVPGDGGNPILQMLHLRRVVVRQQA